MSVRKNLKSSKLSVYIVAGQRRDAVNDRVEKVAGLRDQFAKLTLLSQGNNNIEGELQLLPYFNPTGILRVIKLNKVKTILDKYVFFPSTTRLYVWAVENRLKKHFSADIRNGLTICLIICAPPHDLCLAGLTLKRKFPQIRWLMDWQDLWSYDDNYFNRVPNFYRHKLLRLEKEAFRESDLNITTNSHAGDVLKDVYNVTPYRIVSIPHHYSSEHPVSEPKNLIAQDLQSNKITIGFLGTLFKPPRVPGMDIVHVIQDLRNKGLDVELHIHGLISIETREILDELNPDGIIMHGETTHEASLELIKQYDFLLLLLADLPNSRAVMSIKLPHYLLTGLPILAVVPDKSAIADIIRKTGSGYVIDSSGYLTSDIHSVLSSHLNGVNRPHRNVDEIQKYSWRNISNLWLKAISG